MIGRRPAELPDCAQTLGGLVMQYRGLTANILNARVLAGTALVLVLAAPTTAFAQDNGTAATFEERYPTVVAAPETTQATPEPTPVAARTVRATRRVVTARRAPTRVLVVRRSFLDAGTDVQPRQERKYLDYAFSPTHTPTDVVTNTGGRVGWHNSPMPGPFFPYFY
jgi:hypothetical protein